MRSAAACSRDLAGAAATARGFALALALALAGGCALPAWMQRAPAFPAAQGTWEVALFEPLTQLGPHVLGTVSGRAAPGRAAAREEVLFYVDSGSSQCSLSAQTFARLGVEVTTSRFATIVDAAGDSHPWAGGVVPGVRLGDGLALADVVASVDDRRAILGANVIAARGWQIDLDRGTLLLGGAPWAAAPDVAAVPTHPFGLHALVDLRVAGQAVPVLVDTGAPFTVVDVGILRGLGLREQPLQSRWPLGSGAGGGRGAQVESTFQAPVSLGDVALGQRRIYAHPSATTAGRGMLGNDVLSAYAFQVTPAGLRLRPRAPALAESAGARIARWRELPSCPGVPGCIAAELVPAGPAGTAGDDTPRVRVRFLAVGARPFRFLYGCADGSGALRPSPLWIEVAVRQPSPGAEVEIPVGLDMPPVVRRLWAAGCSGLVLLDANPIVAGVHPLAAAAEARFAMDVRRATFN